MSKSIEERYKSLSEIDHILFRSGMWIGSTKSESKQMFIYDSERKSMVFEDVDYVPGLLKIIDEVISNSCDEFRRPTNLGLTQLSVTITKNGEVTIEDNGGIPVVMHKDAGCYVPEFLYGRLRTSSNYNDDEDRNVVGTNGVGGSLAVIFSNKFTVDTADGKKMYHRTWKDNMKTMCDDMKITDTTKHGTKLKFQIDFSRFECGNEFSDGFINIIEKRCIDAAAANSGLKVIFEYKDKENGRKSVWKFNKFDQYIELYSDFIESDEGMKFEDDMKRVWIYPSGNINIGFVNGAECSKGTHIKGVRNIINTSMAALLQKKEKIEVTPRQIDSKYSMFICIDVVNPAYNSQTKEELTTPIERFSRAEDYSFTVPDRFINKVLKSEIYNIVLDWYKQKSAAEDLAQIRKLNKQAGKKLLRSDKFINCNSRNASEKCLYIAEGASAVAGFRAARDPQTQACYEMRGVPLNTFGMTPVQIMKNQVFSDLINIIGLKWGEENTPDKLNFGKIVINSDMDPDGNHIAGLLIMFFSYFPELFKNGMICRNMSPIIIAEKGTDTKTYFTLKDYKKDEKSLKGYTIKYVKGLGTLPNKFYKDMMRNPHYQVYDYDEMSSGVLRHWFAKGIADERRQTLSTEV